MYIAGIGFALVGLVGMWYSKRKGQEITFVISAILGTVGAAMCILNLLGKTP